MPKYSIIIPAYNGMPYLKSCVESIISQNYDDYELIISEDHSTDGTAEYIDSLKNDKILILHTPSRMSMSEHWEWALSHASGEWLIFVGQDDGLQGYFFRLADKLTSICEKKKMQVIMSERAYYFWPGCQEFFGNNHIIYNSWDTYSTIFTKKAMKNGLYRTNISYMDIPSMYTTSLFKKDFILDIKNKQSGKIFLTHPQDANLAALVTVLQKKYLKSYIPLGWVGSSVKSAGLAMSNAANEYAKEYLDSVEKSELKRHQYSGRFEFQSFHLYYWSALLTISELHDKKLYQKLISKKIKKLVFSRAYNDISFDLKESFNEFLLKNSVNRSDLKLKKNREDKYFFYNLYLIFLKKINKMNFMKDCHFHFEYDKKSYDMCNIYDKFLRMYEKEY